MNQPLVGRGALPSELWEDIILRSPPIEIPSMRLLSRRFRGLIDNSPAITYYLDLFSAGLEERLPGGSLTIQDRRQKLETYCSRWGRFDHAERTRLLDPPSLPNLLSAYADKGFLIYDEEADGFKENICFMRLPSPAIEIPQKKWDIRGLPGSTIFGHSRAIYPPLDLLAIPVLSQDETSFQIQMFRMSDGKPYPNDARAVVMECSYDAQTRVGRADLELTSCRILASVLARPIGESLERGDIFVWDWRTGKVHLRVRTPAIIIHFIDEYRLVGTVLRGRKTVVVLWDTSNDCNHSPGLVFEIEPQYADLRLEIPNYDMNHVLPFREVHSMGIIAFAFCATNPGTETTAAHTYVIPVGTLASFSPRIGTTECVPWKEWQHFATPIGHHLAPLRTRIFHSQMLSVHRASSSVRSTSVLRIYDFSFCSRRRKVQQNPSAPLPPYTVQEFPLGANYRTSSFEFTEAGVLVTSNMEGGTVERYYWAI